MALVDETLYVANADALVAVPYRPGQQRIEATPTLVARLPGRPVNHHWTKSLLASAAGSRLYVSVGSNIQVGQRGMGDDPARATSPGVDPVTCRKHVRRGQWVGGRVH